MGFASHQSNLAVCDIPDSYINNTEMIHALIRKLKQLALRAVLCKLTFYTSKTRNVTRRGLSFEKMLRSMRLCDCMPELVHKDADLLMLKTSGIIRWTRSYV